ncbi:hypothetical protein ACHAWF_002126 [Thalassiosira exigua]
MTMVTTAFVVALTTIIFYHRDSMWRIANTYKSRRELRRIAAEREVKDTDRPRVSGLFIYPIKSLRPVSLSETKFDRHGLIADRRLMIVGPNPTPIHGSFLDGEATHRFFTQRQAPSLTTIDMTEPAVLSRGGNASDQTILKLSLSSIPGEDVHVDVHPSMVNKLPVRYLAGLWSNAVEVADVGDKAAAFVAKVVARDDPSFADGRVVSIAESRVRAVNELYCPDADRIWPWVTLPQGELTDGFPVSGLWNSPAEDFVHGLTSRSTMPQILVTTQASLEELNRRLASKGKEELPMSRFRPNIVISNTSKPFDEDNWKAIQIGKGKSSVILHIVKGCPRCKQSCTDQLTGRRGDEPLETLSEFWALGASDADVYFAQNAVLNADINFQRDTIRGSGDNIVQGRTRVGLRNSPPGGMK